MVSQPQPGPIYLLVLYIGYILTLCLLASHPCSPRRAADGDTAIFVPLLYTQTQLASFRGRVKPNDQSNDVNECRNDNG